jgi:hypothetical protein
VCRAVEYPPEASYIRNITPADVRAWFTAMGSPDASVTSNGGTQHPYMQRTSSLDFCSIFEGEITLVLDDAEVELEAGDQVILRGVSHAWSNRSDKQCIVLMSQHAGALNRQPPIRTDR